ncbi:sphingosine-1-phosphate lyase [Orussus abietinus]|uniref:sphingosine-1-phosphate lyase n=1 Tax=Orussus abietinus TaxID=222816 RepID=UPI000625FD5F|nr:sphingosine-1-phosphate lyase [Orussus abietinus]XP_012283544.1 sphingosine-1-phosphate lyase [Orussus abietinus]XP_012283545.1 sphingosine-1-phosphate lyase [Orussus abietinus]XP_012283546.1 sphingosine-1-phosphate lyase [Orussus abietinus]XP_012283547.1 sphingosine-1-phosphate lyase [Orussus abietinus]XP_012283548.1 sphingosine-1-phosphate lyase [Orussus abietinus]
MYIPYVDALKGFLNNAFQDKEPWQIVTITSTTVFTIIWLRDFIFQDESLMERGKKQIFKWGRYIPAIKNKVDKELDVLNRTFQEQAMQRVKGIPFITKLPSEGLGSAEIVSLVKTSVHLGDYDWHGGKVSGTVYRDDGVLQNLIADVYRIASYTNPLHADVFPGICKMEAEVVRATCYLFNGNADSCGTMTTGGTESILLACKAYRDYAKEVKGITRPNLVMPVTAHSAFDKAAQYLKIKILTVPVNPHSYTVSIAAMKRAINKNTIMLVGSAPNFPYGTMDNIEAISELGKRYNIPVHVDACLGGFLICFMSKLGYKIGEFDFRLPGVTSISADTHKYGYAPKGSSVILYRSKKYRHHQFTTTTDWPGGIYGSPTVNGSRAGGIIAACWATMMFFGYDGYLQATKKIVDTTRYIEEELRKMDGIFIFGTPATSVIALGSTQFDIYRLCDALNLKGWNLNTLQFPSGIHICVTHVHTGPGIADEFLNDVRVALVEILRLPQEAAKGKYAVYGVSQTLLDRSLVSDITRYFLDAVYYTPETDN